MEYICSQMVPVYKQNLYKPLYVWEMDKTQTQTQTKFIPQKQIQVPYQVYTTFISMQIILQPWHINHYKHVGISSYICVKIGM